MHEKQFNLVLVMHVYHSDHVLLTLSRHLASPCWCVM